MPEQTTNDNLRLALEAAYEGSQACIKSFFELFLVSTLYVPERFQDQPMSDQPEYPNDFFNLLGVQDSAKSCIPCFSSPDLIVDWCGEELKHKEISGSDLVSRAPENWWIVLNPGEEIEKEFSPWEIERLNQGSENIPELVEEILPNDQVEPLSIQPLEPDSYPKLKEKLIKLAESTEAVSGIYMVKEIIVQDDDSVNERLLFGIKFSNTEEQDPPKNLEIFSSLIEQELIGDLPFTMYSNSDNQTSIKIGLLEQFEPIYLRKSSTKHSEKILGFFKKYL